MPGRQRTFELVPDTLAIPSAHPRCMTSKEVKKAYQKKNRGPKVSRAEQRRLDALELAQQKAEYDKERNALKAKAVREKKAAKEQAERAERKKKGLPEPSRHVRASQPMISMFVHKGNKRSWQAMEEVAEETDSEGTICDPEQPPAKRAANSEEESVAKVVEKAVKKSTSTKEESDDEFGDFPSMSQYPEILAKVDSSPCKTPEDQDMDLDDLLGDISTQDLDLDELELEELPPLRKASLSEDEFPEEDEEVLEEMVRVQLLSEAAVAVSKSDNVVSSPLRISVGSSPPKRHRSSPLLHSVLPSPRRSSQSGKDTTTPATKISPRQVLQQRSVNMPPPMLPPKLKQHTSYISTPATAKVRQVDHSRPPSATQAFLETHLDDFFPSPSQEVRELLEDIDDIPTNTQIAKELHDTNVAKKSGANDSIENDILACFSSQFALSPDDYAEIDTPSRPPTHSVVARPRITALPLAKLVHQAHARGLAESTYVTIPRGKGLSAAVTVPGPMPLPRPPEKEDTGNQTRRYLTPPPPAKPTPRAQKPPMFVEKEIDLVNAAIHESRIQAQQNLAKGLDKPQAQVHASPAANPMSVPRSRPPKGTQNAVKSRSHTAVPPPAYHTPLTHPRRPIAFQPSNIQIIPPIPTAPSIRTPISIPQSTKSCSQASTPPAHSPTLPIQRSSPPPQHPTKPQPRRRFFEEKEEDLFRAAIHESTKPQVAPRMQKPNRTSMPTSGIAAVSREKENANPNPYPKHDNRNAIVPPRRVFKRVTSTATDYGDEELGDEDLLALC